MSIALLVIGLLLFVGGLGYLIYLQKSFLGDRLTTSFSKSLWIKFLASILGVSLGLLLCGLALFLAHPEWSVDRAKNMAFFLIGLFFFAFFNCLLWSGFIFHYYKKKIDDKDKKTFTYFMFGSILPVLVFFLLWTEGLANYLTYPLPMGFKIGASGIGFTYAGNGAASGEFHIAWYGIIILLGVAVAYWISDHKFYKEFHKHGILDNLVLWAFPAGIIGARIWYVVGNWQRAFANRPFSDVFRIWDGGLTILGGAFAGIVVGFLFLRIRRKYVDPRWAVDVCAPTILLAQAIGRWGNFFNCEVYGQVVSINSGYSWLPTFILNQMAVNNDGSHLAAGMINVPLFLIESLLNIAGYFIIVYGLGKGLKKYLVKGDLFGFYFLWYGIVRIIMEPMRNSTFNMGSDNAWSICNSLIYIIIGLAICLGLHLHDYYLKTDHKNFAIPLASFLLGLTSLFFPFLSSLTAGEVISETTVTIKQTYTGFNVIFGGSSPALCSAYILMIIGTLLMGLSILFAVLKKDKFLTYSLIGGAGFLVIGSLMFFFGKNWTSLPTAMEGYKVSYSLSYGFVLIAAFGLFSSAMVLSYFLAKKDAKKIAEVQVNNV
jgi:phosphatidylglycerol:prolipoprotein diacylglycerol transferase